jgi:acetyl esterase/lipase
VFPWISIVTAFLSLIAPPSAIADSSESRVCTYHYYQQSTEIDGHKAIVEYYVPDGGKSHPLVFMLHSSAGAFSLPSSDEPLRDNFGEKTIARSCFVVVFPHYLEAIGYKSMISKRDMVSRFPMLLATTDTLLTQAESLPSTKGKPVFLFGESLGGYLSLALSLRRREVMAVSEISSGIPAGFSIERGHSLAVLISHGTDDSMVPVQEAEELRQYCERQHLRVEMDLYPGTGHYFPQPTEIRLYSSICG